MAQASNLKRDVLVMNLEQELGNQTQSDYGKAIAACSNEELYYSILQLSDQKLCRNVVDLLLPLDRLGHFQQSLGKL